MAKTWVLVADSSRARIFASDSPLGQLQELETLAHPEGRLHEQDLTSDLPGRSFDRSGQGRHAMETKHSPREQEAIIFARSIAKHLDSERQKGSYSGLILVAPPAFLGVLRDHIDSSTAKLVTLEVDKNLAQESAEEIRGHLPSRLPVATQ